MGAADIIKQHLIDPEICIRCNTCEDTCPIDAITHDDRNYVVKADVCNACNACLSPCPTGAIDNWRTMLKGQAYTIEAQLTWDELPEEVPLPEAEIEAAAAAGRSSRKRRAAANPWPFRRWRPVGIHHPGRRGRPRTRTSTCTACASR
jgi:benzoyl-CoA 2,3-dioxygenase component A